MRSLQHLFFDLDRTLWDFDRNSESTLQELFTLFKLKEVLGVSEEDFILEYQRINEVFWDDYRKGMVQKEELRHGRFVNTLAFFGHEDMKLAADFGELYISQSPRKTGLIDGCMEVLEYLRPNYQLHIITNGFEEVQHIKMESSGLQPFFRTVITSEASGAKKPDRIIFDHAQRMTGALPHTSMMIGDHYGADIVGAIDANWDAVLFEPQKPKMEDTRFRHIHHLKELMDIL